MPPLSYMSLHRTHYEEVKFQWKKNNRINWSIVSKDVIPVAHCSTLIPDDTFIGLTTGDLKFNEHNIKQDLEETLHTELNIEYEPPPIEESSSFSGQTTVTGEVADSFVDNNNIDSDDDQGLVMDESSNLSSKVENVNDEIDGSNMDEEYAMMIPMSVKEAKAAIEVYKLFTAGKYRCQVCNKSYYSETRLKVHLRMHDKVRLYKNK